jgi:hypothetical protein
MQIENLIYVICKDAFPESKGTYASIRKTILYSKQWFVVRNERTTLICCVDKMWNFSVKPDGESGLKG